MRKKRKMAVSGFLAVFFAFWTARPALAVSFCNGDNGVETALGCLPFDINALTVNLLGKLMAVLGGAALLLMVYGSFLIITSAGNQEKVKSGKEVITAAISGLVFAIFSLFLLRFIGVDVLHIPGLQ